MKKAQTYATVLKEGKSRARKQGLEESAVELLMLEFSGLSATNMYLCFHDEMPEDKRLAFFEALHEYLDEGRPVQYIIGHVNFYGYKINVDEHVLIPRFETEELVQNVLDIADEMFPGKEEIKVLDIGTGSGCIAIALKMEEPRFLVHATDISNRALEVAKTNAYNLGADLVFHTGDLFSGIQGEKFDIIVSNPPYIPESETIPEIIAKNEPDVALYGGTDGLIYHKRILDQANEYIDKRFLIAFEHGFDKARELRDYAQRKFPECLVFTKKDMQGRDRMTFIEKR